jgi:uncharacterized protein (DUF2236 family)
MMRRMGKEALVLLGGGRAILLQLAHPLVAAGVDNHSDFQRDPLERLLGTLELMHTLVFGTRRQARQAQQRFNAVHAKIQGRLQQASGRFPAGTIYHGDDPALKLWVAATLVDTGLVTYSQFVAPLTLDDRRRYYADALRLAALLGIPAEIMPQTLEAFHGYMQEMLVGDTLAVDARARRLARDVFRPADVSIVRAGCARLLRFVASGLLPPRLRAAYGLHWNARRQWLLRGLGLTTRRLRPVVPTWVWQSPQQDGALARLLLGQETVS